LPVPSFLPLTAHLLRLLTPPPICTPSLLSQGNSGQKQLEGKSFRPIIYPLETSLRYRGCPFLCLYYADQLFNLKFTSKSLARNSKKCLKTEKEQKAKLKKAIQQSNMEGARIYAQNAIREKTQALNYLRLSSRIDAVASRVETAVRMGQLTKSMGGVVKGMDKVLASMDVDKIAKTMDKFEQQFEDLDVRSAYMEGAMGESSANSTPAEQVDELISQTADAHGLELGGEFDTVLPGTSEPAKEEAAPVPTQENDLAARLAALK